MKRNVFDVDTLDKITKFVHGLNLLTKQHGISLGHDGSIWIDDDSTSFNLELDSVDGGYVLTQVTA